MNQIDNLVSKSLYRPTDGFRFSNATGDNLTLQGKYALDGEIKLKIQSIKDNLITDVKAKQDLIDALTPKYNTAESLRSRAQSDYDEANSRNPKNNSQKKQKEADKTRFSRIVSSSTSDRDSYKKQIDKLNGEILTLKTNAQTKLDDLTKQQNELATSINDELEKAKQNNDPKASGLKPVDKVVSPNVSGKTTVASAVDSVTKSKSKTYMYIGIGLVLLVGGYFLVKKLRK